MMAMSEIATRALASRVCVCVQCLEPSQATPIEKDFFGGVSDACDARRRRPAVLRC